MLSTFREDKKLKNPKKCPKFCIGGKNSIFNIADRGKLWFSVTENRKIVKFHLNAYLIAETCCMYDVGIY